MFLRKLILRVVVDQAKLITVVEKLNAINTAYRTNFCPLSFERQLVKLSLKIENNNFQLTLWGHRKRSDRHCIYVPGFTYGKDRDRFLAIIHMIVSLISHWSRYDCKETLFDRLRWPCGKRICSLWFSGGPVVNAFAPFGFLLQASLTK